MIRLLLVLATLLVSVSAHAAPTRIAVLYFENQGNPELEMLKLGLAQMLITDLAPQPDLEVVERTRLNEILGELELQKTAVVDPDSAVRIGKVLGVEYMVQGYYLYFAPVDSLIVGAQLVSVETGAVVSGFRTQGKQADFLDLESQLVAGLLPKIREAAGTLEPPAKEPTPTKGGGLRGGGADGGGGATKKQHADATTAPADDPPSEEVADAVAAGPVDSLGAALAFSEGLDALDHRDIPRARQALRRAVELDPTLDDARAALAEIKL